MLKMQCAAAPADTLEIAQHTAGVYIAITWPKEDTRVSTVLSHTDAHALANFILDNVHVDC